MARRVSALLLALFLALACARSARADEGDPEDGATSSATLPRTLRWKRSPIFDPLLSPREALLSGSLFPQRVLGEGQTSGFGLAGGTTIASSRGPLFVRGQVTYGLRVLGGDQVIFGLGHYAGDAGLALGPIDLSVRFGLAVADVHFGKGGFELGFLSPSVGAGAAVHVGRVRIGVVATSEYDWTWLGGPSARVRLFSLDLAFEGKPQPPPWPYYF